MELNIKVLLNSNKHDHLCSTTQHRLAQWEGVWLSRWTQQWYTIHTCWLLYFLQSIKKTGYLYIMARVHIISFSPVLHEQGIHSDSTNKKCISQWRSGLSNNRWQAQHYGPLSLWTESECTVVLGAPVHSSVARHRVQRVCGGAALATARSPTEGKLSDTRGTSLKEYPERLPVLSSYQVYCKMFLSVERNSIWID